MRVQQTQSTNTEEIGNEWPDNAALPQTDRNAEKSAIESAERRGTRQKTESRPEDPLEKLAQQTLTNLNSTLGQVLSCPSWGSLLAR